MTFLLAAITNQQTCLQPDIRQILLPWPRSCPLILAAWCQEEETGVQQRRRPSIGGSGGSMLWHRALLCSWLA